MDAWLSAFGKLRIRLERSSTPALLSLACAVAFTN